MSEIIVGIDLGTTNSEVAVVRDGRVEVIAISEGVRILPSMVGLADDGALLVGEAARNQYVLRPERTVRSIKRRMGEATRVSLGDKDYSPQEISALILRRLKQIAENHLGQAVNKAVITVPAYFSDAQRQATREAGEIAGLEVVRIINEPTAAALAYETGHQGARRALVYDLGGGTFDVSVVNLEGDVVEVLASHGNNHLGGDDFDQRIVDFALDHLQARHGADVADAARQSGIALARLQRAAEAAKITLSDRPYALLAEEYLLQHQGEPVHLAVELSRSDYEAMIEPYIAETLDATHIALAGARLTVSDIDEILLVGGATRTPLVARRLEEALGLAPRGELNPDLCVAMGAAIQAGVINGDQTSRVLVDVTPYTFGTSAIGLLDGEEYFFCFVPLIRKNTPIPVSKSEVFYTAYEGQERIDVGVYQGEDRDALNNVEIGQFTIDGLRADAPAGSRIVTTFSLDLDGILHVTTREKETGMERSITIANALARQETDQLDAARERVRVLFGEAPAAQGGEDDNSAEHRRRRVEAQALVEKAERLLGTAGAEDGEDLVNGIEVVKDALEQGDEVDDVANDVALKTAMDSLADLLYYLEA
ncbi:MAG: Hsp70 family protein [Pseudomonadota bacterium]|nr:Hsp70 family protein [Pseudomonadota bacterium]